jgi:hypothetical protein
MRRCLRLLACLPVLATTACAADAIAGPEPAPEIEAAADQLAPAAPEPAVQQVAAAPAVFLCRATSLFPQPTEPLYVVDGVIMDKDALQRLDPNDIETSEVLKESVAASLYGTRAAKGLVIIELKRGSPSQRALEASYRR